MGTCVVQLTYLRKVGGHLPFPIIDCQNRKGSTEVFLCLYVVVNIANEDKKLQTPADIIPLYARKI